MQNYYEYYRVKHFSLATGDLIGSFQFRIRPEDKSRIVEWCENREWKLSHLTSANLPIVAIGAGLIAERGREIQGLQLDINFVSQKGRSIICNLPRKSLEYEHELPMKNDLLEA